MTPTEADRRLKAAADYVAIRRDLSRTGDALIVRDKTGKLVGLINEDRAVEAGEEAGTPRNATSGKPSTCATGWT